MTKGVALAFAMGAALAAPADSARFLSANAGATVDEAADYLLPANWRDAQVGNAAGRAVSFDARSTHGFVKLTADVTAADFAGFAKLVLVGDRTLGITRGANDSTSFRDGSYYVDLAVGEGVAAQVSDSRETCEICGDLSSLGSFRMIADTALRADRYAKTADAVRVTPWKSGDLTQSGNSVWHYAPRGADAVTGTWRQTAGSPYLFPAGADATLAVGTAVTGAGVRPGTFLKRIFPDGSIELSQPAEETRAANEIAFAAFDPTFTQVYATWRCIGANGRTGLVKARAQDEARLVFSSYSGNSVRGIAMPAGADGLFPGTVVLSNAWQLASGGLFLGRCRVELPGTALPVGAGLPKVPFVAHYDAESDAALVVPAGVSATVNNFTNLVGTLVKEGAGTLTLNLENELARNTGTLAVREGTLVISSSTGDAFVRNVTLSAGAVLKIPAGAFRCETLDGAAGAAVDGPGTLLLGGLPRPVGVSLTGGATLEFAGVRKDDFVYDLPAAGVAGDPAMWLEVSSGITTDASGEHVLRWDDVRGGDRPHVYSRNEKLKPQLVKGADGTAVSVLLPCDATSASADDQAILMWSRPLSNIRAVFIVKSAYQGGGQFLGGANGMWMRPAATGYRSYPLFNNGTKSSYPALANGRFYVNGERRSVDDGYAYPGGTTNGMALADWKPQLAEFLTAGNASADNFAYNAGGLGRTGRQILHAAIVYTNELTEVERLATERYLLDRYRLMDVQVPDPATLAGSVGALELDGEEAELAIAAGGAAAVETVSGSGTLAKRGAGLAFVKDLASPTADVVVSGGELVIRSAANDGRDLPGTPALHVDASLAASVTTNTGGKVTKWADVRGETVNVATNIPGTWGTATVVANAVGARAAIAFPYGSYTAYANASPDLRFDSLPAQAFFSVAKSEDPTGSVLLGCGDDRLYLADGRHYGIRRSSNAATRGAYAMVTDFRRGGHYAILDYDHALVCSGPGATVFRENGADCAIESTIPAEGYRLVACATPEPVNTSAFSQLKNKMEGTGAYTYGGVTIGESIIYTNTLSRGAVLAVEAYLNRKWFGRETPGYRPAQAGRVAVAPSARVTVTGGAPLEVRALASEGAVDGSVTVADGGTVEVVVAADGTPTPLGVSGALRLAGDGTLVLRGNLRRAATGSHLLASDVTAAGTWTVARAEGLASARTFALRLADGSLYLDVSAPGAVIVVR